jgi:hypothetical protein
MNPFIQDARSRLSAWKQLRNAIQAQQLPQQQLTVALEFWRQAPLEKPLIDWDHCENWPTAWELLHNNRFCESSLSLAVALSLLYSDMLRWSHTQLVLITDRQQHVQKIVVLTQWAMLNHGWLDMRPVADLQQMHINRKWSWDNNTWREQALKTANMITSSPPAHGK